MAVKFNVNNAGQNNNVDKRSDETSELRLPEDKQVTNNNLGHEPQIVTDLNIPKAVRTNSPSATGANAPIAGSGGKSLPKLDDIMGTDKMVPIPPVAGATMNNDGTFATGTIPQPAQPVQQPDYQMPQNQVPAYPQQQVQQQVPTQSFPQQVPAQTQQQVDPTMGMAESYIQNNNMNTNEANNTKNKKMNKLTWILIGVAGAFVVLFLGAFILLGGFSSDEQPEETDTEEVTAEKVSWSEEEYPSKIKEIDSKIGASIKEHSNNEATEMTPESMKKVVENTTAIQKTLNDAVNELNNCEPPEKYAKGHEAYINFLKEVSSIEGKAITAAKDFGNKQISSEEYGKQSMEVLTRYMSAIRDFSDKLDSLGVKDAYTVDAFTTITMSTSSTTK